MKKAFDSISLLMLEKALRRIKIPQILIKFIINLYKNRRMRVIMSYGLTKEFTAEDEIDQGEVIFPLVWQIFYDPLLERVQRDKDLGFIAKVSNLNANGIVESSSSIRQAVLAYADDTTWIATSKKQMERTIEIAEQFFYINDIEINGSKSKLVVLNSGLLGQDKNISFCKAKLVAEKKLCDVKFLGVYLSTSKELVNIKRIARSIVGTFVHILEKKGSQLANLAT